MISDYKDTGGRFVSEAPLLTDLIRYITMGDERNKIIFVGDHYQLPPVVPNFEKSISYALAPSYLQNKFKTKVGESALTKVMRQDEKSDVFKTCNRYKR
ncbi:MAG: hypothetical protein U5K72_16010 [Balneolaceae bacterium]|nr:hypothetical protein [Balneolaceae bacterium]